MSGPADPITPDIPDYTGGSLVNLVAELEYRLSGASSSPRLRVELARRVPTGSTYVLLLMDGLGARQLEHPAAAPLRRALAAEIDAPFPTTTTVSWATIATGVPPRQHGLLGYQLHLPETSGVVNTIKWTRPWGESIVVDFDSFLPGPNLWERLTDAGLEPITIQPGSFTGSNLSRVLFRGCRFEPAFTADEMVDATLQLATARGRLIVVYLPHVDVAAHMQGQASPEYDAAVAHVASMWQRLLGGMPDNAVLIGTADHGHIDYPKSAAASIRREDEAGRIFYGDSRVMFVKGDGAPLADYLPASWVTLEHMLDWWGPGPAHPEFASRAPDGALVADPGAVLLHKHSDTRLIGQHGGLVEGERLIPLLVASSPPA